MTRLKYDLTGQRFGDWEVLSKADPSIGPTKWTCRCTCGTIRHIPSNTLRKGMSLGCGCKRSERVSAGKIRHGQSAGKRKTRLYHTWVSCKQRCGKWPGYETVKMHQEWRDSFEAFAAAVGEPPTPKHSIDRIDCSGNYEPGNVRWATPIEQGRNKSNTIKLTYKGVTKPLRQWADELEIPAVTLHARIKRYGMSVEEAFSKPIREQRNNATSPMKILEEWARKINVPVDELKTRVANYIEAEVAQQKTLEEWARKVNVPVDELKIRVDNYLEGQVAQPEASL